MKKNLNGQIKNLSKELKSYQSKISILKVSTVPHNIEKPFAIRFKLKSTDRNEIYLNIKDSQNIKEKILINFKKIASYSNKWKFIKNILLTNKTILNIWFHKSAHLKIFEIHDKANENRFGFSKLLLSILIDLLVKPNLDMIHWSHKDKDNNLYLTFQCKSYEGLPNVEVIWRKSDSDDKIEKVVALKEKKWMDSVVLANGIIHFIRVTLKVEPSDENKFITCFAGESHRKLKIIYFYKHPDGVEILKSNPSEYAIMNGDYLTCKVIGDIKSNISISWFVKSAPTNYENNIKIYGKFNESLAINNSPEWSQWNVSCFVTSFLFNSVQNYTNSISFLVTPSQLIDKLSTNQYHMMSFMAKELKNMKKNLNGQIKNLSKELKNKNNKIIEQTRLLKNVTKQLSFIKEFLEINFYYVHGSLNSSYKEKEKYEKKSKWTNKKSVKGIECPKNWYKLNANECFHFGKKISSYYVKINYCKSLGGDLASIHTKNENYLIAKQAHFLSYSIIMLGGSDRNQEGVWEWSDGSPFNYTQWDRNEPNNKGYDEDCIELKFGLFSGSNWNDMSCSTTARPVCKANNKLIRQSKNLSNYNQIY